MNIDNATRTYVKGTGGGGIPPLVAHAHAVDTRRSFFSPPPHPSEHLGTKLTPASIRGNMVHTYFNVHLLRSRYTFTLPCYLLLPFCFYNFTTCTLCAFLLNCCVPLICLPMYACGFNGIHVPDALIL